MCNKGGQRQDPAATAPSVKKEEDGVWVSPYNPLAKDAPELPTKGLIKAVIPKECFQRSYVWSVFYLFRDVAIAAGFVYACSQVLSTDLPTIEGNEKAAMDITLWVIGWSFYAFWMGTIMTGLWVLAHECGHGAFSPSQGFNDAVGFIVHNLVLLVPYFSWQYSHAKHHRRTNHLTDGETFVPTNAVAKPKGVTGLILLHHYMGDTIFASFTVCMYLLVGWPLYLSGLIPAGQGIVAVDGTPLVEDTYIMDHFRPSSPLFPSKMGLKVLASTVGVMGSLAGLCYLKSVYGVLPVMLWYWGPYCVVNGWLVLYTWLHHTDASVPHYSEDDWTWVHGALSTIDRPYGIFDFFHHDIGSTHVTHHLFHEIPWYNADKATVAVKAYLGPKGLYNYDPTPVYRELWRVARTCHYVEGLEGIQYYKSLQDISSRKSKVL
jgi:fatty acid desaturase